MWRRLWKVLLPMSRFDEQSASRWSKIREPINNDISHYVPSRTGYLLVGVANRLSDESIENANYEELKKSILDVFNKSAPELFESIVGRNNISMTKATLYINEIRKIGQLLGLNDYFLKTKFMKGLPDTIRPISKNDIILVEMTHAADLYNGV